MTLRRFAPLPLLAALATTLHAQAEGGKGHAATHIDAFVVNSTALGEARTVWVHRPPGYGEHRRTLPVTFVLDGHDARLRALTAATVHFDTRLDAFDPDMPEQLVVGIESRGRGSDFGRHAAAMRAFITDELLPLLHERYRVGELHTLVGHSLAGAFALETACAMPSRFLNVVAISPALDDTARVSALGSCFARIGANAPPRTGIFVTYGSRSRDASEDGFRPFIDQLERELRAAPSTGQHLRFVEQVGVSHARTTLRGIPEGLAFVLARTDFTTEAPMRALLDGTADPLTALDEIRAVYRNRGWLGAIPVRWHEVAALRLEAAGRAHDAARVRAKARDEYPEVARLKRS